MDIQEMREEIESVKVEINATPRSPIQTAMKDVTLVAGRKVKQQKKMTDVRNMNLKLHQRIHEKKETRPHMVCPSLQQGKIYWGKRTYGKGKCRSFSSCY